MATILSSQLRHSEQNFRHALETERDDELPELGNRMRYNELWRCTRVLSSNTKSKLELIENSQAKKIYNLILKEALLLRPFKDDSKPFPLTEEGILNLLESEWAAKRALLSSKAEKPAPSKFAPKPASSPPKIQEPSPEKKTFWTPLASIMAIFSFFLEFLFPKTAPRNP